jgi:hypothetical protein
MKVGATLEEYYKYYLPQARAVAIKDNPYGTPAEIEEDAVIMAIEWADDDYARFVELPAPQ